MKIQTTLLPFAVIVALIFLVLHQRTAEQEERQEVAKSRSGNSDGKGIVQLRPTIKTNGTSRIISFGDDVTIDRVISIKGGQVLTAVRHHVYGFILGETFYPTNTLMVIGFPDPSLSTFIGEVEVVRRADLEQGKVKLPDLQILSGVAHLGHFELFAWIGGKVEPFHKLYEENPFKLSKDDYILWRTNSDGTKVGYDLLPSAGGRRRSR